jgi:hypothetical protein
VLIASRAGLPALERELALLPSARPGVPVVYHRLSPGTIEGLRGIAGIVPGDSGPTGNLRLAELLRRMPPGRRQDVWTWQMDLVADR